MPKPVFLSVFANGYCAPEDHEGRVHGHIQYQPSGKQSDASLPFVGCHLIATAKASGEEGVPAPGTKLHHVVKTGHADAADWDHIWEYDTEPTKVPLTPYYLHALRSNGHHGPALLPADEKTYLLVHGTKEGWRPAQARLHQYAVERGMIPQLTPSEAVVAAKQVHESKRLAAATVGMRSQAKDFERDHEAEWKAFVGDKVLAERAAWEAAEPTHPNFVKPPEAPASKAPDGGYDRHPEA